MISAILTCFFYLNLYAADINQLNSVNFEDVDQTPTLTFEFEQDVNIESIEARFIRRTIEWDLASTKLKKDKLFINVSKNEINNVYASHNDKSTVRIRVNLDNGVMSSNYHERIKYFVDGKKLRFKLDPNIPLISSNIKEISRIYNPTKEELSADSHLQKAEEHILASSTFKIDESEAASLSEDIANRTPEEKIPLKIKKASSVSEGQFSFQRMASGFLVLTLLLVSVLLLNRKMKSKKAGAAFNHDSITVISQKYLGPKRNLVLIRVTGEYLLLGVTDHNISLIKNLNIVDDEIPELTPRNFGDTLAKKEKSTESSKSNSKAGYPPGSTGEPGDAFAEDIEDSFSVSSLNDVKKIFKKKRYIDEMDF